MKFAKILGLPLSVLGLILYLQPMRGVVARFLGGAGLYVGAVIFATGWALLLGYLMFNLGMETRQKEQSIFETPAQGGRE